MEKMKKIWNCLKKITLPLLILFLLISASFIIFGLEEINISDKIQAWAIVTLILVTAIYSYQTYRLVKQQEKTLNDEREKRAADFAIKRIKEFYSPLSEIMRDLEANLETEPIPIESIKRQIKEILELFYDYIYMVDENDVLINFTMTLMHINKVISEDKKIFQNWKSNVLDGKKKSKNQIDFKVAFFREKINEAYGYFNKEMMNELEKRMKTKNENL